MRARRPDTLGVKLGRKAATPKRSPRTGPSLESQRRRDITDALVTYYVTNQFGRRQVVAMAAGGRDTIGAGERSYYDD
ncbi:MAG: hypothetical protein ABIS34_09540 [Opitutus sp.]